MPAQLPPDDPPPFAPFPTLDSERIYDCEWCGLRRDLVELPDGRGQPYHVFEIPDASVVVPVTDGGEVVLVGQYRYPHGGTYWEVPAGRIGDDETPEACARRELREEAGLASRELVRLPSFYPVNGISGHLAHAFLALGCERAGAPELDATERIVARTFPADQVRALLDAGRVRDGFSALALHYAFARLDRGLAEPE